MNVGIVGCGTAGPAAAILLARAGHSVDIFDRAPSLEMIGAGLLLQPLGMAVAEHLGCAAELLDRGARVDRLFGATTRGATVLDLHYSDLSPKFFGLGVQRGVLFGRLQRAVLAAGVAIHEGVEVTTLGGDAQRPTLVDTRSAEHGPFDLVVVADGARSRLRESLPGRASRPSLSVGRPLVRGSGPGKRLRRCS